MNKADNPRKALGKGLGALLTSRTQPPPTPVGTAQDDSAQMVPVASIDANPLQPRRIFQPERLAELAQSIRVNGIIQPLVVRRVAGRLQLVAGERRLRAAQEAGLHQVPVVIRDIPDDRLLEITLVENIQREDLNPMETATAFSRLAAELTLTPEEIGRRTGKDRSTVLNFMRLLQLPADIQQLVADRRLSASHARCLLSLPTVELQRAVAEKVVTHGWSVRQTELTTQKLVEGEKPKSVEEAQTDPNVKAAIAELMRVLGTRVRIVEKARKGGRIEIEYYSNEDLQRIYATITGDQ